MNKSARRRNDIHLNLNAVFPLLTAWLLLVPFSNLVAHPEGTILWSLQIGPYSDASPAVGTNGVIYFSTYRGKLWAINPDSTVRWTFSTGFEMKSSPAIGADGTVYVGCRDHKLHAVRPDGKQKWEYKTGGWVDSSPALGVDGTIYFGSWDGKFYALSPDGFKKWDFTTGGPIVSSPAIGTDGAIYFGSHDKKLYALNPDGTKRWEFATGGQIISSPAIGPEGTIYFTSVDGKFYALNPDGTKRWQLHTGGITESSPVLGPDGTIYVGINSNYCAITRDGRMTWRYTIWQASPSDEIDSSGAIAADGTSFFSSDDRHLFALGPDGKFLWNVFLVYASASSPVIGPDGTVYVLSWDPAKGLYAVKGTEPLARSSWPMFRANPQHTGCVQTGF